MTTSPEKIRRAIRYAANARKNIADVASVNFYLGTGEHISQADLDAHHAGAREIPPLRAAEPEPAVEVDDFGAPVKPVKPVEPQAFNEHQKRQLALMVEETAPPSESLENFKPLHANGAVPSHDEATPDTAEPEIEPPAVLTIGDARKRMVESQIRLRSAVDKQAQARQRVARAIGKWQAAIGNIVTDTDLRRQHLAHEAEQRELRAAGLIPPRGASRVLQSRVDQIAAATAGAAYGKGTGHFAYKRGATDIATSQRRLDAMLAAKLPSER
jgi:hypothetical protein